MNFQSWFQEKHPTISIQSAEAVLELTAGDATVPFIARYRKEKTGNLDEVAIQKVIDAKEEWDEILKRQKFILEEIERQKKLTPELKEKISTTFELNLLEDLYLPYKQKRKTKAALAKEAGLEPLADWIWNIGHGTEVPQPGQTLDLWAFTFRNEEKGFADSAAAIQGAQDIIIERLSETQHLRQMVRTQYFDKGFVTTKKGDKAKPNSKFENYFEHEEPVQELLKPQNSHRYLAMRRGWMEEELSLQLGAGTADPEFEKRLLQAFEAEACPLPGTLTFEILQKAARLSLKAHVISSIENEVHKSLKQVADDAAISVFAENVRKLLMSSPYGPKAVLGVDPGLRTGCKVAVVDDTGKYIASTVIHLMSESERKQAGVLIRNVIETGSIRAIAVGNGTAGRETEIFLRQAVKEDPKTANVPVVMVNESGASVYSASEVARNEFPDLDLTVRGAISIARRLQDPLAELVKIDPKSIGVGQYQHDVSQTSLKKSLDIVVDSCVNQVGVNLNTASEHLLAHVAGIGPSLARAIVEYRSSKGLFDSREKLLSVPRFTKKVFEQAAGFLRIPGAENPLDNTGVHPERYEGLKKFAENKGSKIEAFIGQNVAALKKYFSELVEAFGEFTAKDIIAELEKPGRDPREEFIAFTFREDIHEVKDLKPGMTCPGIVTNVTNFGAFVDIGVHQDGLVHLSQLADRFVKDAKEVVSPGDRVQVKVLEVNFDKNQIALTMRGLNAGTQNAHGAFGSGNDKKREHQRDLSKGNKNKGASAPKQERPGEGRAAVQPLSKPLPQAARGVHGSRDFNSAKGKNVPTPKKQEVFNNAFAGLASLKAQLKTK